MTTLEQIQQQIAALPHRYIFYTKKEIRYLPKILNDREQILALTSGYVNANTWLAICTNRRVLFLHRGMFFGLHQIQMNLDRIQSIDSSFGLIFGTIRVWDGASAMNIRYVWKSTVMPFVKTVQDAMDKYKRQLVADLASSASKTGHVAAAPEGKDLTAELERLAKLKAEGHLSELEFAAAKTKLLG